MVKELLSVMLLCSNVSNPLVDTNIKSITNVSSNNFISVDCDIPYITNCGIYQSTSYEVGDSLNAISCNLDFTFKCTDLNYSNMTIGTNYYFYLDYNKTIYFTCSRSSTYIAFDFTNFGFTGSNVFSYSGALFSMYCWCDNEYQYIDSATFNDTYADSNSTFSGTLMDFSYLKIMFSLDYCLGSTSTDYIASIVTYKGMLVSNMLSDGSYYSLYYYNLFGVNPFATDGYIYTQTDLDNASDTSYNNGYRSGYNNGYSSGYDSAVGNVSNPFVALFNAVFNLPLKYIQDLCNFELFGVNLNGLVTGLLTFLLVIWLLKKALLK